jgi:hypothetical protein
VFEDPSDFPRSPGKVLDELGHQFKVRVSPPRLSLSLIGFKVC